jgi:hypothetical protein
MTLAAKEKHTLEGRTAERTQCARRPPPERGIGRIVVYE